MAITNAQQYQQLVNKRADGKRPGYRGDDAARSSEGTSGGRADPGGAGRGDTRGDPGPADDRGTAQQNANQRAQVRAGQVRAVENLIDRPPVGFTDAARINLFNYSPTSLAVKGIKNLGTAIANSKIGQFMNAKQREAYLDSLDTDEQVAALEALGKIGIGTTNPMGIDRNITRGTEKGIFGTNIGGGQFITDPNLGSVEAKTALGTGYQDYLDDITSRFDNTDGGDGGQTYIPPVLTPYQEDVVEEVDPNSLQGLLANRVAYRFMADGGRAGFMGGGMPDDFIGGLADGNLDEMGRQMYGLGKLVKKATRAVKKIVKSPVGKAALLAGGAGLFGYGPAAGLFSSGKGLAFKEMLAKGILKKGATDFTLANLSPFKTIGLASLASGLMTKPEEEDEEETYYRGPGLDIAAIRRDPYAARGAAYGFYAEGGDVKEPVAKDTMPLLDMNGMEKDYRADGGFVPIGRMERADDVPARLSKNEFVFTADAVRNAGDGDVDKGAEVMYNMMKNLESGGKVSEESQGLDGARDMFQTSKRLEEVL